MFGRPFQRSWVWAKPVNTFNLRNLTIAKQLAVWRLEQIGASFAKAIKENTIYFHSQRIALTMVLAFLITVTVACFNKLSLSTQTS